MSNTLGRYLETCRKCPEALNEGGGIIPKTPVPGIGEYLNLCVWHASLVLIDGSDLNNGVISAVSYEYRLVDPWQEIIIIERAREECLPDVGRNGDVVAQHQVKVLKRELSSKTKP